MVKRNRKIYMLVGIPYSGKTFYRDANFMNENYMWLSSEYIIEEILQRYNIQSYDEYWNDLIKFAKKIIIRDINHGLDFEYDFVWDECNLTRAERADKLSHIPEDYQKMAIVFPFPSNETIAERMNLRPKRHLPWQEIDRLKGIFEMPSETEGFDEIRKVTI